MNNPELSDLIKPVNLDLPEHLVTITEMDLSQMARLTNSGLGSNNEEQMKQSKQSTQLKTSKQSKQMKTSKKPKRSTKSLKIKKSKNKKRN